LLNNGGSTRHYGQRTYTRRPLARRQRQKASDGGAEAAGTAQQGVAEPGRQRDAPFLTRAVMYVSPVSRWVEARGWTLDAGSRDGVDS
jgi:hypothetical protein